MRHRSINRKRAVASGSSFFNGWRSTPGTTPLASQLVLLISTTTTKVEIGSNAARLRLRSLTCGTGQPPSVRMDDEGATTSAAPPHSFSHLGSKRQVVAACDPAPVTRLSGSAPGTCFAGSHSPWSPPFAPSTPLRLTPPRIAPQRGATLFADFPATMARSDFSCPCIIGFDSSSSRCGPSYSAPTRHRWPDPRSPSFRCDPFARDVALDPGRASVLLSARRRHTSSLCDWRSDVCSSDLSWLNPTPHAIAVYASRPLSPVAAQHSLPSGRYSLLGPDFHRLDRTSLRLAHVAVGTRFSSRPPHRTVRAAFPHTAPTSGV